MNKCKSCGLPKGKHKLYCCNNVSKPNAVYVDLEKTPICKTNGCNEEVHRGNRCIDCWLQRGDEDGHRF